MEVRRDDGGRKGWIIEDFHARDIYRREHCQEVSRLAAELNNFLGESSHLLPQHLLLAKGLCCGLVLVQLTPPAATQGLGARPPLKDSRLNIFQWLLAAKQPLQQCVSDYLKKVNVRIRYSFECFQTSLSHLPGSL